jgi:hypothetical protein
MLDTLAGDTLDGTQRAEVGLAQARLELAPLVGNLSAARARLKALESLPLSAAARTRVELLMVAAILAEGRYPDGDRAAGIAAPAADVPSLLDLIRLLDLVATATDSDLVRRRYGKVVLTLTDSLLNTRTTDLTGPERTEFVLFRARALLFRGDGPAGRTFWTQRRVDPRTLPLPTLILLADTESLLGEYPESLAAYQLLAGRSRPGSRPWLEARYSLALTYEQARRFKEARQILDATAILHPDLGGGELRTRIENLRGRLTEQLGAQ